MTYITKWLLIILAALCIVSGQALMSVWSRGVPPQFGRMFAFALTSPLSYGVVLCYGIGSVFYLMLLRNYPLAEVTLTILACMMCMVAIFTLTLGQTMTATQWLGAALTGAGVILLQVR